MAIIAILWVLGAFNVALALEVGGHRPRPLSRVQQVFIFVGWPALTLWALFWWKRR